MGKVTDIEARILQLGPGEFQKFCDAFLSRKGEYGKILGLGMKSGTLKTTIGNPDTYFRKDNGKYIFVAYTAQQDGIYSKLKDDIDKCFDASKTGVDIQDIEEIICCHTSSTLKAGDDLKLHNYCKAKGVKLTIFGVDEIAQQIYRQYKSLAKDFLDIAIDTNQIMSVDEFINLYDANEMAAPLDTIFQFREGELKDIESALLEKKAVVIYGRAGTGKTRIVLEAVNKVAREQGYRLLCVKNNNLGLYDDLVASTEKPGKYLFFIDDANELVQLKQILQYTTKGYLGYEVKVIVTVRDYVKENVIRDISEYVTPQLVELRPFTDDEIRAFLDVNMEIRNEDYVERIVHIAEGNPRIAFMAGKLAKEKQTLSSINDATQLYDHYYSAFVDSIIGSNQKLCLTAGILAMLGAVILDRLDHLDGLLELGGISREEFKDNIYMLSKMEFVEIQLDQVATISDQCLANYMLYYSFFENKRIKFSEILKVGFNHFRSGVIKSLNTLLNIFANDIIREYLASEIRVVWEHYKNTQNPCYEEFVQVFHIFRPEEAFILAHAKIEAMDEIPFDAKKIDLKKNCYKSDDDVLKLLTGYQYSELMETVMELFAMYVSKTEENALVGYHWLENHYGIDQDSYKYDYYTEQVIAKELNLHCEENEVLTSLSLSRISYALAFEFQPSLLDRGNVIRMYRISVQSCKGVNEYRKVYWECLEKISKIEGFSDKVEDVLLKYANSLRGDVDKEIIEYDQPFVLRIVNSLSCGSIRLALILRELLRNWTMKGIDFDGEYRQVFMSSEWNLYQLLENNFMYSELSYEEYEKDRENTLIKYADELKVEDVVQFVKSVDQIICDNILGREKYSLNNGFNIIADRLCDNDQKASVFFKAYIDYGHNLDIHPGQVLLCLLKIKGAKEIYEYMEGRNFPQKNYWQFAFFEVLPEEYVNQHMYSKLIEFLKDDSDKEICSAPYRRLRMLDKFKKINCDIYVDAASIIFEKRRYSDFIVSIYFELLFHDQIYSPQELITLFSRDILLLKDIYFYMLDKDGLDDLHGIFLIEFLENDESWLDAYTTHFWMAIEKRNTHDHYRYKALWNSDNYQKYFDYIFYHNPMKETYYTWRISSAFQEVLCHEAKEHKIVERQEAWILHMIRDNATNDNIYIVFDMICELGEALRRKAIEEFLRTNPDYEVFKKIQLEPSHWGGTGSLIPVMQNRIDFLKSLFPYVRGVPFLQHKQRIQQYIDMWEARIKSEEIEEICRKLNT